jgi:hypothetical protein
MLGFCGPIPFNGLRLMLQRNIEQKETFCPEYRGALKSEKHYPIKFTLQIWVCPNGENEINT